MDARFELTSASQKGRMHRLQACTWEDQQGRLHLLSNSLSKDVLVDVGALHLLGHVILDPAPEVKQFSGLTAAFEPPTNKFPMNYFEQAVIIPSHSPVQVMNVFAMRVLN